MSEIVKFENIEKCILEIRNQKVIMDFDVAELYGVQTKEVNQAVKNNAEKFPYGYVFQLTVEEFDSLRSKILTANLSKMRTLPKAFTEKGLYMLATILRGKKATETTIGIIETFTKIRELTRTVNELSKVPEESKQKSLIRKSGEIISEVLGEAWDSTETETSIELNFAVLKVKHTIKHKNGSDEVHEKEPIYIKLKDEVIKD